MRDDGDDLMVIHLCCPCLNSAENDAFPTYEQKLIKKKKVNENKLFVVNETITKMPISKTKNELEQIKVIVYNFENLFLSSPNMANTAEFIAFNMQKHGSFDHLCEVFGGQTRVRLLAKHFDFVCAKSIQLICFSNCLSCKSMQSILTALGVNSCFDEQSMIGYDHKWFDQLKSASLNEKLLKITQQMEDFVSAQSILYVDSNTNTFEVSRCQIMAVFGINALSNLKSGDIVALQSFIK